MSTITITQRGETTTYEVEPYTVKHNNKLYIFCKRDALFAVWVSKQIDIQLFNYLEYDYKFDVSFPKEITTKKAVGCFIEKIEFSETNDVRIIMILDEWVESEING